MRKMRLIFLEVGLTRKGWRKNRAEGFDPQRNMFT